MNPESSLEHRLRSGLEQAAPSAVVERPDVGELRTTVDGRRQRNRMIGTVAAAGATLLIGAGVLLTVLPDSDATDVIAAAPDTAAEQGTSVVDGDAAGDLAAPVADAPEVAEPAEKVLDDAPVEDAPSVVSAPAEETVETAQLQADDNGVTIETQASAVDFAGGSGVLLVPSDDGFVGLATRFGGAAGVSAIGLSSADGLNWTEVDLSGIPAGATATALREHDGTYVGLFSLFDVDEQRNNTFVGTSADLAVWSLAPALSGSNAIATDVAVGSAGVIVVGVAPGPRVWTGPLGGPYVEGGTIDATTLAGVAAIDAGFVAVGTNANGPSLFGSVDGSTWSSTVMSGIGAEDMVVGLSVQNGAILLAGDGAGSAWTATSADGGQIWQRNDLGSGTVGSVSSGSGTISFLGSSALGANTVTISDGQTWSSASVDVAAPNRVELLVTGDEAAVLLATVDGELTWILASR